MTTNTQARYRHDLPQLRGGWFLTDGGLETTLVFRDGIDLPCFAACEMLRSPGRIAHLKAYFEPYLAQARALGAGFILESPTWRAHADWAGPLGYSLDELAGINRRAIAVMEEIRATHEGGVEPIVISACMGPRGDGYRADTRMSADAAEAYHRPQVENFAATAADLVSAFTLNYPEEAIGIARAARAAGIPAVISFTVETDGRLPSGESLGEAITAVDAATDAAPVYYMLNCAHPSHFRHVLDGADAWLGRLRAIRANASCRSHAELDGAEELDTGDPEDLGRQYRAILDRLGQANVLGGCCGTDHRHIAAIARACAGHFDVAGTRRRA